MKLASEGLGALGRPGGAFGASSQGSALCGDAAQHGPGKSLLTLARALSLSLSLSLAPLFFQALTVLRGSFPLLLPLSPGDWLFHFSQTLPVSPSSISSSSLPSVSVSVLSL